MKKVFALVLALVLVLGLAACGDKDKKIENPNLITIGDYQALYTGAYITADYEGDDALVASFTFTNNSDEPNSFMWAMFYTPMQGGVEMENSGMQTTKKQSGISGSLRRRSPLPSTIAVPQMTQNGISQPI